MKSKKAYSTYIFGKNALISPSLPELGIVEKKKMKKITVKQQLKYALESRDACRKESESLRFQLSEQNILLNRVRNEGNQLVESYNKLAGKYNAIRSLVTNND